MEIVKRERRVMNPFLDWSFKYLFGTEESKPNLIGFLNLMLMPQSPIVDLEFMNNESLPSAPDVKGCVFDIICRDENGDRYLIEMQNGRMMEIKERIIYYTCRLMDRMGRSGSEWDYSHIKRVYSICLMNFTCESNPKLRRDIQLRDMDEHTLFSDKLNIILLQIPCLKAESITECNWNYEFLLYLLKEMQSGMKTIEQLKQEVAATKLPQQTKDLFYKVLDTADVGSLSEKDQLRYESDLKNYMDTMSCIKYATIKGREEGLAEGRAEGRAEGIAEGRAEGIAEGTAQGVSAAKLSIAKSLKAKGIDPSIIAECTGLSEEEILNL